MQQRQIGITLNGDWDEPFSNSTEDVMAAEREKLFQLGWFADPVWFGDYPQVMKEYVGDRLPSFTQQQQQLLRGSHDFFGFNHYTSRWVSNNPDAPSGRGWETDKKTAPTAERDGEFIGPVADSSWLYVVPWGMRKILNWIKDRYDNPAIMITENGCDVPDESSMPLAEALNDTFRVNYFKSYLAEVALALNEDGVNVTGYFAWSMLDNFEWADGYSKRFGIHYVDYANNLTRYKKNSALWFKDFIQTQQQLDDI